MEILFLIGVVVFFIWVFLAKTSTTSKPSQNGSVNKTSQNVDEKKEEISFKPQSTIQSKAVQQKLAEDFKAFQVKIKLEQEAKYRLEQEAKIKQEQESKIKQERETKIKLEQEANYKLEQEAKIKLEREALQAKSGLINFEPQNTGNFKADWNIYKEIITKNGINCLYHFTDSSNIESIIANRALYSWSYCLRNNIEIPCPGGDGLSRSLDNRYNLGNYVRLSFTRNHPMMFVAQNQGRIVNPVILEIDVEAIYWKGTKFSDKNATRNDVNIGDTIIDFNKIQFDIVNQRNHFDLTDLNKPYYQAEVLIFEKLPIEFIRNIYTFRKLTTQQIAELDELNDLPF